MDSAPCRITPMGGRGGGPGLGTPIGLPSLSGRPVRSAAAGMSVPAPSGPSRIGWIWV